MNSSFLFRFDRSGSFLSTTLLKHIETRCGYIPPQVIEHSHVCIHVVEVVGIGWVVLLCPVGRQWTVQVEDVLLRFGLIVHTVKTHNLREKRRADP